MVSSTLLGPLGVVLATALPTLAFDRISIASTVKADTEVELQCLPCYHSTGWGTGPVCPLENGTKIDTTSVKIKIPADIVPSDAELKLTTMEWDSDPKKDGPSGFQYSNTFSLEGATGSWGKSKLAGSGFGDMDTIPCTAYSCIRKCNDDNFDKVSKLTETYYIEAFKAACKPLYDCMTKCPGTTMPSWDALIANSRENESSSTAKASTTKGASSSSPTGTATTTVSESSGTVSTGLSTAVTTPAGSSTQSATSLTNTDSGATRVFGTTAGLALAVFVTVCHWL